MQRTLETWIETQVERQVERQVEIQTETRSVHYRTETGAGTRRRRVVSLFDSHGSSLIPWRRLGFDCEAYDFPRLRRGSARAGAGAGAGAGANGVRIIHTKLETEADLKRVLGDCDAVAFVIAFPPCRDICAAGARWWKSKRRKNPRFQEESKEFLKMVHGLLYSSGIPFTILVPISPVIRACFSRRGFAFSPHEYGGYLPAGQPHPLFSEIPAQDAYTKRTLCFHAPSVRMPWKKAVSPTFHALVLKNGKTKRVSPIMKNRRNADVRAAPPLGFCTAVAQTHHAQTHHAQRLL